MMKTSLSKSRKQGFTLVEVALAVLAVGFGLMTIIGLFPAGLQNASDDAADTRAGLFAGLVFNGMRGAATNADVNVWDGSFIGSPLTVEGITLNFDATAPTVHTVKFSPSSLTEAPENYMRYVLSLVPVTAGPRKIYSATLSTCDGQYGPFTTQNVFYTEFYYTGM